ncbi:hypothetical protein SuNHUV7_25810 (plasmid) [Pseudoseohaeicola sp. NH-UV-7]|uniref:hypothetical protein n=1 Tax=Sulfitobacter sp. TBRI5 TaxID=2989732 RepID=UPI003A633F07
MHGLINKAIERFVRDTCGDPDWDRIVAAAGLVLSDQFELVSARTVRLILMPHRDRATQPERRRG